MAIGMACKCQLKMHSTNVIGNMFFQWPMICWMTMGVQLSCKVLMMQLWNWFFLHGVVIRFLSLPKSTCTSTIFVYIIN